MNRRQLAFVVIINAVVSLVIALSVIWVFEMRRPDPEALAAIYTPLPQPVLAGTPTSGADSAAPTPSPTIASVAQTAGAVQTPAGEEIYTVQGGDSLLAIATRYHISVDDIVRANNLTDPDFVFSGQRLIIPVNGQAAAGGAPAASTPITQGVQISAVDGAGDLANESVLLVNESDNPFSLQGWKVERANGPSYTFGNVPLFPGGSVRLHSAAGSDTSIDFYWNQPNAVWQSGAVVQVRNAQGDVVTTYTAP